MPPCWQVPKKPDRLNVDERDVLQIDDELCAPAAHLSFQFIEILPVDSPDQSDDGCPCRRKLARRLIDLFLGSPCNAGSLHRHSKNFDVAQVPFKNLTCPNDIACRRMKHRPMGWFSANFSGQVPLIR
jgi:hypothetical protein